MKKILYAIGIIIIAANSLYSQGYTKGAQAGEFYYQSSWYAFNFDSEYGVIFSSDHGQTIQYQIDSFGWNTVLGDMTDGMFCAKYNDAGGSGLLRSFNYAVDFDTIYFQAYPYNFGIQTGTQPGELIGFTQLQVPSGPIDLYTSIDTGLTFQYKTQLPYYYPSHIEAGSEPGHLYRITTDTIRFSSDYGQSFTSYKLDKNMFQNMGVGAYTQLRPGGVAGEVYIGAFDFSDGRYNIFRSTDYGQSFSFRYRLPYYDIFSMVYRIGFQGGREEGEFYIFLFHYEYYGAAIISILDVYYSSDGGLTYEIFHHNLGEPWSGPVGLNTMEKTAEPVLYPNPVQNSGEVITIKGVTTGQIRISIFNTAGQPVFSFESYVPNGDDSILFSIPTQLAGGLYFVRAEQQGKPSICRKLLVK